MKPQLKPQGPARVTIRGSLPKVRRCKMPHCTSTGSFAPLGAGKFNQQKEGLRSDPQERPSSDPRARSGPAERNWEHATPEAGAISGTPEKSGALLRGSGSGAQVVFRPPPRCAAPGLRSTCSGRAPAAGSIAPLAGSAVPEPLPDRSGRVLPSSRAVPPKYPRSTNI